MKKFARSLPGKVITYIAFLLSAAVCLGSIIGAATMVDDGRFYKYKEETISREILSNQVRSSGWEIVDAAVYEHEPSTEIEESYDYIVKNQKGEVVKASKGSGSVKKWNYEQSFFWNKKINDIAYWYDDAYNGTENNKYSDYQKITVFLNEKEGSANSEWLNLEKELIHIAYTLRFAVFAIALATLITSALLFIALICVAGRKPDDDEYYPGPFDKVPFDLICVCYVACGILGLFMLDSSSFYEFAGGALLILSALFVPLLCMSFASRVKRHSLLKNTLIYRFLRFICRAFKKLHSFNKEVMYNLPSIWKTLIGLGIFLIAEFIPSFIMAIWYGEGAILVLWVLINIVVASAVIYVSLMLNKLQNGVKALASGDFNYVTDTSKMILGFKEHGDNLNSIAGGLAIAVEDRLKSERMKTELITNVSHDLKTPLTSVINYANLIGEEKTDNENIIKYSQVLVRQSEKLKRLIEDLVEVSKASTGNLEVELAPCDACVFINQASGEYENRLRASELTLVVKEPDEEVRILADGRRMWRVFDNLMNNICKYSLGGTRVYLTLEKVGSNAVITFKNTSKEPLDISEEELMERFTRGDSSRNTEGNGLGLSIAKSLTELQKGEMKLTIDGDLFKVALSFPLI